MSSRLSFLPRLFPVNVYLVEEEDGLTLIDAGMPFSYKGILKAAGSLGKPITRIILTHAHGDHVGALDRLHEALPDAEVCISSRDALLLKGDASLLPHEPQTPVRGSVPKASAPVRTGCWKMATASAPWSPSPHQAIRRGIWPSWIRAAAC